VDICIYGGSESEVAQLCLTLCNAMDYSLPGSSVHGVFQAIVLEWIAISFSRVYGGNVKANVFLEEMEEQMLLFSFAIFVVLHVEWKLL